MNLHQVIWVFAEGLVCIYVDLIFKRPAVAPDVPCNGQVVDHLAELLNWPVFDSVHDLSSASFCLPLENLKGNTQDARSTSNRESTRKKCNTRGSYFGAVKLKLLSSELRVS